MGLGVFATVIGVFSYGGDISDCNGGVFCNGASWGGFFASVPRGFFATVPACRGFFASVSTSRQGNFKTKKIQLGNLVFSVFFLILVYFLRDV